LNIELIKWSEDADCAYFSFLLPEGLDGGMEVLPDGLRAGIPEAYAFGKTECQRIVGEGEGGGEETVKVAELHHSMRHIICSSKMWYFHVIPGEHLAWLIYKTVSLRKVTLEMCVNLIHVLLRHP
jgi:hypothetical protein